MRKRRKYAKTRAPKGFRFEIRKHYDEKKLVEVIFALFDTTKNMWIGEVSLVRWNAKWFETHSTLVAEYWNKKLGVLMYCRAIEWALKNRYKVRSSGASSECALRVWNGKTIRQNFKVRVRHCRGFESDPSYDTFYVSKK